MDNDPGQKPRILVFDDCQATAALMKTELEKKGYTVRVAHTVEQATKSILNPTTRPEWVFLDVVMPRVSGEQFCRFIKGNGMFEGIKVVLCSAISQTDLEATATRCGADGFVHKESLLGREALESIRKNSPQQGC